MRDSLRTFEAKDFFNWFPSGWNLHFRPNDGSKPGIDDGVCGSKGLMSDERPNDGSKAAKRSFKSHFLCPSRNADPRLGSSPHSLFSAPITRAENGGTKSCT